MPVSDPVEPINTSSAPDGSDSGLPSAATADIDAARYLRKAYKKIVTELEQVVVGQRQVIKEILIAMFAGGHCLVVGVPGLAKTLIVKTMSQLFELQFSRIQFTPDLMPSDIIGTDIVEEDPNTGRHFFKFYQGPIFANIVLADEINRTPPKTQAALLEAMQEQHVTAGGNTHDLPLPFFVLATQNPIEQEGTYPLPEAQQDRFMFSIRIDYPSREDELAIAHRTTRTQVPDVKQVMSAKEIRTIQRLVRKVPASPHVIRYATDLVRATRPHRGEAPDFINEYVAWGAGPRATQYLVLGAKVRALLGGNMAITCQDVRKVALPVLRHRIFPNFTADADGLDADALVDRLLGHIPEPSEKDYK